MKKFSLFMTIILFIVASSTIAQDDEICSASGINEQIDTLIADYESRRDDEESDGALSSAENLSQTISDIVTDCRESLATATSDDENPGTGSTNDPFRFNQFADGGDGTLIKVSGIIRPADRTIRNENMFNDTPSDGEEYVIIFIDVLCSASRTENCEIDSFSFELVGDNGVIYEDPFVVYDDEIDINVRPGGEGGGGMPFLIQQDDTNLQLAFYPDGVFFGDDVYYFSAEPSASDGVTVVSTSSLNVRGGPSTNFGVVGSLPSGEQAIAFGRNEDGTWLQILDGWVFTELVETGSDVMALPVTTE